MTKLGIVHSKYRKFVVIARFATHVLALPIYTHGGRGLASKSHKNEFVSIRDADSRMQVARAESIHNTVWHERYPEFMNGFSNWFAMTNHTSVHLTAPYSHPMSLKCTISGRFYEDSTTYLQELYRKDTAEAFSAKRSVKLPPDANGYCTVKSTASSRNKSIYGQAAMDAVLRGRDSYRPSTYQPRYR